MKLFMEYISKLTKSIRKSESVLCVGLDPNPELFPEVITSRYHDTEEQVVQFCKDVIDVTQEYCCAYKPNLAFFESIGDNGLSVFNKVLGMIPDEKIVIADAKRGDIGSTAEQYKRSFFDHFQADAITLNPLMGFDTLDPFIHEPSKAIYSLVLTSNPGANDLLLRRFEGRLSLAEYIADQLRRKMEKSQTHIGMVVGATYPSELKLVLDAYPQACLLIPGVGSQGGKTDDLIELLTDHEGIPVISSSRSIIYAGGNQKKWKDDVAESAKKMKKELKKITMRYV
jgi:orotidine-5'-phosphate decarboxylase